MKDYFEKFGINRNTQLYTSSLVIHTRIPLVHSLQLLLSKTEPTLRSRYICMELHRSKISQILGVDSGEHLLQKHQKRLPLER